MLVRLVLGFFFLLVNKKIKTQDSCLVRDLYSTAESYTAVESGCCHKN